MCQDSLNPYLSFLDGNLIKEREAASILKFDPNNCVRMDLWLSNCGSQLSIVGLADII